MEQVPCYECIYNCNSKDFKDKSKKPNCCELIAGEMLFILGQIPQHKNSEVRTGDQKLSLRVPILPLPVPLFPTSRPF